MLVDALADRNLDIASPLGVANGDAQVRLRMPRVVDFDFSVSWAEGSMVVGRKNRYGSCSKRGTEVAAICYSLVETAKLCGIDPRSYLVDAVLVARRDDALLPHDVAGS